MAAVARIVLLARRHRGSLVCVGLGMLLGSLIHARLTPLCPAGAACIFGPPGVQPYVEYSEVAAFWAVYDVQRRLYEAQSAFQQVAVYDTYFHGRIMTIDGALMITERDERNYHEMLTHVPLNYLPADAKRVLVIGGGDGGTVTQVVRHPSVQEVAWVEIDELVVRTSRRYFPKVSAGADDPRVKLHVRNAAHWVAEQQFGATRDGGAIGEGAVQGLDVVLIDSTDFNQAEPLFSTEFYASLKRLMSERSILCLNADSPQWGQLRLMQFVDRLTPIFRHVYIYQAFQPTYSSGHYAFLFASDSVHPTRSPIDWAAWAALGLETRYYTPDVHYSAFMLTAQVRGVLRQAPPRLSEIPTFSTSRVPSEGAALAGAAVPAA
jgi:spermidine synthase